MHPSTIVRLSLVLCGALGIGMLSASAAEAGPKTRCAITRVARHTTERSTHRRGRAHVAVRRADRHSTFWLFRTERLVHWQIPDRLERRQARTLRDTDAAALQSSAAAVSGEDDLLVIASLELLGLLSLPPSSITINGAVTPRSPRGPPSFRA